MTVCGNSVSGICSKCQYFKLCHNSVWDKTPKKPKTNEEWLRELSFNELARVLYCMIINGERIRPDLGYIKRWLKEKRDD